LLDPEKELHLLEMLDPDQHLLEMLAPDPDKLNYYTDSQPWLERYGVNVAGWG